MTMTSDANLTRPEQATEGRSESGSDIDSSKAHPQQAAYFLDFAGRDAAWTAIQNKKIVRKVDMRLLPLLIAMYMLNFLDRSNLAQARQGSLERDLGMKGTDFNLATSIFFVSSDHMC